MARVNDDGVVGREVRQDGRWTVVTPPTELDPSNAPALRDQVVALHEAGVSDIALDWGNVTFFDSSAIGVLMGLHKRLREDGGSLVVICATGRRRRLFDLMALDQVFTFVDSDADLPE